MLNLTVKLVKVPTCQITSPAMSCKYCHLIISRFMKKENSKISRSTNRLPNHRSCRSSSKLQKNQKPLFSMISKSHAAAESLTEGNKLVGTNVLDLHMDRRKYQWYFSDMVKQQKTRFYVFSHCITTILQSLKKLASTNGILWFLRQFQYSKFHRTPIFIH